MTSRTKYEPSHAPLDLTNHIFVFRYVGLQELSVDGASKLQGIIVAKPATKSGLGCSFCQVALCYEGSCWGEFHSGHVN